MPATSPSNLSKSIIGVVSLITVLLPSSFFRKPFRLRLILVLIRKVLFQHEKARQLHRRRAWVFLLISLAALLQAMAVRRHGCPMMVVKTVMAGALHLY
jgi:hypothetical protein